MIFLNIFPRFFSGTSAINCVDGFFFLLSFSLSPGFFNGVLRDRYSAFPKGEEKNYFPEKKHPKDFTLGEYIREGQGFDVYLRNKKAVMPPKPALFTILIWVRSSFFPDHKRPLI